MMPCHQEPILRGSGERKERKGKERKGEKRRGKRKERKEARERSQEPVRQPTSATTLPGPTSFWPIPSSWSSSCSPNLKPLRDTPLCDALPPDDALDKDGPAAFSAGQGLLTGDLDRGDDARRCCVGEFGLYERDLAAEGPDVILSTWTGARGDIWACSEAKAGSGSGAEAEEGGRAGGAPKRRA